MEKSKDTIRMLNVGIEYPERRFGVIAIEKGFITVDQLWEGLVRQRAQSSPERQHIGTILKDMGYIEVSQINEVLEVMKLESQSSKGL